MARILLEPFRNLPSGTNSGSGYMLTSRLFPNTLESLVMQHTGTTPATKAEVSRIQIKLGSSSKPIWDVTGAQLNSMNLYEGRPSTATVFVMPFSNPRARTVESQMIGALDMGAVGVRELSIELTLTRATYDTIGFTTWAEIAPPKLFGEGAPENQLFRALLTTPLVFSTAASRFPVVISTAANGGALIRRIHFFGSQATSFELRRDSLAYFEDTPLAVNNAYLDELGHDPQSNIYTFDAIDDDNESKALAQVRADAGGLSLIPTQFLLTVGGAQTIPAIADIFANLNGL